MLELRLEFWVRLGLGLGLGVELGLGLLGKEFRSVRSRLLPRATVRGGAQQHTSHVALSTSDPTASLTDKRGGPVLR